MIHRIGRMLTALALCAAVGVPATALAWAAGTHAYVAKHTNKMGGLVTEAERCRRVLGANEPDLFNSVWSEEGQALAYVLHTSDPEPNLSPYWAAGEDPLRRAFGFGFATHNNGWGSDSTAHFAGRTYGKDEGYVVAKAEVVGAALAPVIGGGLGLPPEIALPLAIDVSHNFVEFAVDFLLAQADPELGWALYASSTCSALGADEDFLFDAIGLPWTAAMPGDPATAPERVKALLDAVNPEFVAGLGANGFVLTLPYEQGRPIIAHLLAVEAQKYLAFRFPGVPYFDPPPPLPALEYLAGIGLDAAMEACAPDFMEEIEATIGRVNGHMSSRGIFP